MCFSELPEKQEDGYVSLNPDRGCPSGPGLWAGMDLVMPFMYPWRLVHTLLPVFLLRHHCSVHTEFSDVQAHLYLGVIAIPQIHKYL